jgi:AcrR family transcriptional regulator
MDGYKKRTEEKKQRIFQAAVELFQKHGINKVTVRDIAAYAGVSHVTVYKHFGRKNEAIRNIVKAQGMSILSELREIVTSDIPLEEKLRRFIFRRAALAATLRKEQLLNMISHDPQMREFVISIWQREISRLERELLEQGIREGVVNPTVSPKTMQLYLGIIHEGLSLNNHYGAKSEFDEDTVHELHEVVLHGLLK